MIAQILATVTGALLVIVGLSWFAVGCIVQFVRGFTRPQVCMINSKPQGWDFRP